MAKVGDYIQMLNPKGYVNNREITNLPGQYLVKESQNTIIVNNEKVASRKGYTVLGSPKTKNKGHNGSFDWKTSSTVWRNLRFNKDGELEVYYAGDFHLLKEFPFAHKAEFTTWWSEDELIDLMLFVAQTDEVHSWSGAITEIAKATATTLTLKGNVLGTTIAFVEGGASPDSITDSANGFVVAGFEPGDEILVSGSASNNGRYTIATVTAGTLTLIPDDDLTAEGSGPTVTIKRPGATWAEQRFLTLGTRKVLVNGTEYAYTAGEDSGTLTGLTGVAGVSNGDIAFQAIQTDTPAALDNFVLDLICTTNNYVVYGSTTDRRVEISKSTDYLDFTHASPRIPGEGFELNLDSTPTAFAPDEDDLYISGGEDDWYKISFVLSADQGTETIVIKKLKTATGQAAVSQGAVFNTKNSITFLSFEPTVDTLGRIQNSIDNPQSLPISDDIKDDLETYDTREAHGLYHRRNLYIALPFEGLLLIHDTRFSYWNPPQILPIGRLALIDVNGDGKVKLCGHSSVSNETYRLFDGYNDNGANIRFVAAFGYENYGARFNPKLFDEAATELYMSDNTVLKNRIRYDYKGATDVREFTIRGDDEQIRFQPRETAGLGQHEFGSEPLGSLATEIDDLSKIRAIDTTVAQDFYERQRVFYTDSPDARFAIIAYGENTELSDNLPVFIKR